MSTMRRRLPTSERAAQVLQVTLLTLLEILPIQACLLLFAAGTSDISKAFGPLWLIAFVLLEFAFVRWRVAGWSSIFAAVCVALVGLEGIVLFASLSPTAYGDTPGGFFSTAWVSALWGDALHDASRFNSLFPLLTFMIYLGWRGLTLGRGHPRVDATLRRFGLGLSVIIAASLGALTVPRQAQPVLQSDLLVIVALEVFAGLSAAALARRDFGRDLSDETSGQESTRWMLNALGASMVVVGAAFLLGALLDLQLARPMVAALSRVGAAIGALLQWLATGFTTLLWVLFVKTLGSWFLNSPDFYQAPPQDTGAVPGRNLPQRIIAPPPHTWFIAAEITLSVMGALLLVFVLYRGVMSLLQAQRVTNAPEMDEEREGLDGSGLLRRQVGALLDRVFGAGSPARDLLPAGTVRWHFRELLRAGAAADLGRRDGETADEYGRRISAALRANDAASEGVSLAPLTDAYDAARYGERDAQATPAVTTLVRSAAAGIKRLRAGR